MPGFMDITSEPSLLKVTAGLNDFAFQLKSFKEPLKRSIQQVLAPAIKANFDDGEFEPLADTTVYWKDLHGASDPAAPLIFTGKLRRIASQLNAWVIDGPGGEARLANVPGYGRYSADGTVNEPQRDWLQFDSRHVDACAEVFATWMMERMARAL